MIIASAPGSFMLFGEHAVLRGKHAIMIAVDKRLSIELTPLPHHEVVIQSDLGEHKTTLDSIKVEAPFHYVLQILKDYPPKKGLLIQITSEMSHTMGFGTSAALVVALIGGLMQFEGHVDKHVLFERALKIVRKIQGLGSGADLAASLWGGVGLYCHAPFIYQKLENLSPLYAIYTGYKTPTPEVVRLVEERFKKFPEELGALDQANDVLTRTAANYLDVPMLLGRFLNDAAGIMESYGVHTKEISTFLWDHRVKSHGIKLSGSGLGDCAIACVKDNFYPKNAIKIQVASDGLLVGEL